MSVWISAPGYANIRLDFGFYVYKWIQRKQYMLLEKQANERPSSQIQDPAFYYTCNFYTCIFHAKRLL